MRKRVIVGLVLLIIFIVFAFSWSLLPPDPQSLMAQKQKLDYTSTFSDRNTKPLGLKEDLISKQLMKQSSIKWAIRAQIKHILD